MRHGSQLLNVANRGTFAIFLNQSLDLGMKHTDRHLQMLGQKRSPKSQYEKLMFHSGFPLDPHLRLAPECHPHVVRIEVMKALAATDRSRPLEIEIKLATPRFIGFFDSFSSFDWITKPFE